MDLKSLLQSYHIHSMQECETINFAEICRSNTYSFLGKGFFSRAFRIRRYRLGHKRMTVGHRLPNYIRHKKHPRTTNTKTAQSFFLKFLPTKEEAWKQYQEYIIIPELILQSVLGVTKKIGKMLS